MARSGTADSGCWTSVPERRTSSRHHMVTGCYATGRSSTRRSSMRRAGRCTRSRAEAEPAPVDQRRTGSVQRLQLRTARSPSGAGCPAGFNTFASGSHVDCRRSRFCPFISGGSTSGSDRVTCHEARGLHDGGRQPLLRRRYRASARSSLARRSSSPIAQWTSTCVGVGRRMATQPAGDSWRSICHRAP
jgi:hypothetical protein